MSSKQDTNEDRVGGSALNEPLGGDDGWEALDRYRSEMINHQKRLAKLAASFLELEAFDDAAQCAIKTAGLTHVIGRIPKRPNATVRRPPPAEAKKHKEL